jgi:endonuclease/exonuclease/phosphatase family metal-dependent hydrolase
VTGKCPRVFFPLKEPGPLQADMSRRTKSSHAARLAMLAIVAGSLGACAQDSPQWAADAARSTDAPSVGLRVMSFNIEWGGTHVRFESVVDAIRASGADIVGVQEAEGNLQRLAADLGWSYDLRSYVVSRYRVIDPPGADGRYAYVEIRPGQAVAIANVHLPSDPYGPEWVKERRTAQAVLDLERRLRLPKIQPDLGPLSDLHETGIPVFLTGDFNAPSHADWTEAVVGTRPFVDYSVDWPVSRAVTAAGFRDSFRDTYPDPVTHPGLTWWAKRRQIRDFNPGDGDPQDRIDFVWYAGPATVTSSEIVGESEAAGVSIAVTPWPSDHRAVVSSFDVVPAPLPPLIAAERRVYRSDETIRIVYYGLGSDGGSITVSRIAEGDDATEGRSIAIDFERGSLEMPGGAFSPGGYQMTLSDASSRSISRNGFWILDPDAPPSLDVVGSSFAPGEALPIRWQNGPGNRNDWLAVFGASAPREDRNYLAWGYVGARSSGSLAMDAPTAEGGWPLPPGRYVVRLLKDDGFEVLAESSPFTVE